MTLVGASGPTSTEYTPYVVDASKLETHPRQLQLDYLYQELMEALAAACLLTACQPPEGLDSVVHGAPYPSANVGKPKPTAIRDVTLLRNVRVMGLDPTCAFDMGDHYQFENCIRVDKADLAASPALGKMSQAWHPYLVDQQRMRDVKVHVVASTSAQSTSTAEVQQAIDDK